MEVKQTSNASKEPPKEPTEINFTFMLGPPGSGHLAHSAKVAQLFGYDYLCVDELIQEEISTVQKLLSYFVGEKIQYPNRRLSARRTTNSR